MHRRGNRVDSHHRSVVGLALVADLRHGVQANREDVRRFVQCEPVVMGPPDRARGPSHLECPGGNFSCKLDSQRDDSWKSTGRGSSSDVQTHSMIVWKQQSLQRE